MSTSATEVAKSGVSGTGRTVRFQQKEAGDKAASTTVLPSSDIIKDSAEEQLVELGQRLGNWPASSLPPLPASVAPFLGDTDKPEEEGTVTSTSDTETLHLNDFSWDEQGFSVMSRLYGDMSLLLDDKFRTVRSSMTHSYRGPASSLDKAPFRRAVWNYTQGLYGILQDDCDYGEVRVRLEPSLRQFIRASCLEPASLPEDVLDTIMLDLATSEKVHVKILLMEAKRQALLLYAMRAVTNHMM